MSILKIPVSSEDHLQGSIQAPATLVEYGDYECPYCGRAYSVVKRLQKHFGLRLCFVFRNFPLTQSHPQAEPAAEAAECAALHGKFWEMHDELYENQDRLSPELYEEIAITLRLPPGTVTKALEDHDFLPRIREDFAGGVRSGVNGTPTFFINGHRHDASPDYESLVAAIEGAISKASKAAKA